MTRRTLEILAICIAAVLAALAFHAWLSAHDDQLRLQSVVASQKQVLDAADAREHDRNATLKDALAQIEILKRQTQTPEQILRDLPKYLPLPQPITLAPVATATDEAAAAAAAGSPEPTSTSPAATAASAHTAAQQGTTAARETPTQILRDLAKYLHLPQPTTRTPVAPAAHAANANADAADAPPRQPPPHRTPPPNPPRRPLPRLRQRKTKRELRSAANRQHLPPRRPPPNPARPPQIPPQRPPQRAPPPALAAIRQLPQKIALSPAPASRQANIPPYRPRHPPPPSHKFPPPI